MEKNILRRIFNRIIHSFALKLPGATNLRPFLHRLRGVKICGNVFIGDDVYIENEYPECVEIHNKTEIALRSIILAHFKGPGRVVIEEEVYIGPNSMITASAEQTLVLGKGSVIAAGSAVGASVPANTIVSGVPVKPIAKTLVSLINSESLEEFKLGLRPIRKNNKKS